MNNMVNIVNFIAYLKNAESQPSKFLSHEKELYHL